MSEEKTEISPTLQERDSYRKTIEDFKKTIQDLKRDNSVLQDDVAKLDGEKLAIERELDSERSRRIRAENLLAEGKKMDTKTQEQTKEQKFANSFLEAFGKITKK